MTEPITKRDILGLSCLNRMSPFVFLGIQRGQTHFKLFSPFS